MDNQTVEQSSQPLHSLNCLTLDGGHDTDDDNNDEDEDNTTTSSSHNYNYLSSGQSNIQGLYSYSERSE